MTSSDYSIPVHNSLQEPDVVAGIGTNALVIIVVVTIILANLIAIWCVLLGFIAFIALRIICKDDPYLFDILLETMWQPDFYIG